MSETLPITGFTMPKNGDPKGLWGDLNITGDLDQANGIGFFPALNKALIALYETPEDIANSLLKLNAKLSAGEVGPEGEEYTQLLNTAQNIIKSIKAGAGITIQDFGNYIEIVSSITNVGNIFSVDSNASFGYATIQEAATAAGAVATLAQPQTVIAYTGTYTEDVNFPPFVNFYGIGTVKIIGKVNFTSPGSNQNSIVQNVIIEHTATSSTDYAINITAAGSVRLISNQITTLYAGDFDVTSISVTGAATIQGRDNQIVTARVGGTSTTNREIIAINAPNVTGDILVKNGFSIAQTTTDENDNLTGLCLGGSAASHVANLLYLVNTTNASYSGQIRGLKYLSNTVNKTFGNMTFQVQDAGAGDFVFVDITADSGLFLGSNIEGYYNGSGTAYLGSVAAGATLAIGGGNQQGMTETFTGAGTAKGYALTNDIFDIHAESNFNENDVYGINTIKYKGSQTSVVEFGAKGDGITDDTTAIQNAITYINNSDGGVVSFPEGEYLVSSSLIINDSKVELIGYGVGKTKITTVSAIDLIKVNPTYNGYKLNFTLKELELEGQDLAVSCLKVWSTSKVLVENCFIHNFTSDTIVYDDVTTPMFLNVTVKENGGDGIILGRQSDAIFMMGVDSVRNGGYGLVTGENTPGTIENSPDDRSDAANILSCNFILNEAGGIHVKGTTTNGIKIQGCYFERNTNSHIQINSIGIAPINNVEIDSCYTNGATTTDIAVLVYDINYLTITNCEFLAGNSLGVKLNNQIWLDYCGNTSTRPIELWDSVQYTDGFRKIQTSKNGVSVKKNMYDVFVPNSLTPTITGLTKGAIWCKDRGAFKNNSFHFITENASDALVETVIRDSYLNIAGVNFSASTSITINADQKLHQVLRCSGLTTDSNLIIPNENGLRFYVQNTSVYNLTVKTASGSGVIVYPNETIEVFAINNNIESLTSSVQKPQINNLVENSPFFYLYNATNSVMAVTSTTFVSPTSANVSSLALTNFSYGTSLTYTGTQTIKKTVFCNPTITVTSNATVITCYWVKNWDGITDPATLPTSQASQGKPKEFTSGVPGSLSFTWIFDLSTNDKLDVVFASDKSVTLTVNAEYTILQ